MRQQKLRDKVARQEVEDQIKHLNNDQKERTNEKNAEVELVPCKVQPPYWWNSDDVKEQPRDTLSVPTKHLKTGYQESYARWQDQPRLIAESESDPCKRREMLNL